MLSQKVVIPAKAGIQGFCNSLTFLDSRVHGNDGIVGYPTFYEFIRFEIHVTTQVDRLMAEDY
jgi:hypothetical protein